MAISNKQKAVSLLKSLETGNSEPLQFINPNKYIQHNLSFEDGLDGLKKLVQELPKSTKVNTVRVFEDGEFVFAHTEYDFFGPKIGFDVLRFEDGIMMEHWDNLQTTVPLNPSGHSMIDGETEIRDLDKTEANKAIIRNFTSEMVNGRIEKFASYYEGDNYIQHSAWFPDQLSGTMSVVFEWAKQGVVVTYDRVHKILGEGNFVLAMGEGHFKGVPTAFYDLWRIENGKITEHWDTIETIPPREEWKNNNGKF